MLVSFVLLLCAVTSLALLSKSFDYSVRRGSYAGMKNCQIKIV